MLGGSWFIATDEQFYGFQKVSFCVCWQKRPHLLELECKNDVLQVRLSWKCFRSPERKEKIVIVTLRIESNLNPKVDLNWFLLSMTKYESNHRNAWIQFLYLWLLQLRVVELDKLVLTGLIFSVYFTTSENNIYYHEKRRGKFRSYISAEPSRSK